MPESSVIHDIGYQRYTGPRLGRAAVFGALYVHGLRAAYGFGRSAKAKIFPWLVFGIVALVAVILAAVRAQIGTLPLTYIQFADTMSWLIIFFVAIVAPELVSRDMRAGVLPLYFSRPLRSADYVGAKVAALATAVWILLAGPQFIIFLGGAAGTAGPRTGRSDPHAPHAPRKPAGLSAAGSTPALYHSSTCGPIEHPPSNSLRLRTLSRRARYACYRPSRQLLGRADANPRLAPAPEPQAAARDCPVLQGLRQPRSALWQ